MNHAIDKGTIDIAINKLFDLGLPNVFQNLTNGLHLSNNTDQFDNAILTFKENLAIQIETQNLLIELFEKLTWSQPVDEEFLKGIYSLIAISRKFTSDIKEKINRYKQKDDLKNILKDDLQKLSSSNLNLEEACDDLGFNFFTSERFKEIEEANALLSKAL